jgi:heterodisulfide reductase subunit B
VSTLGYYPGCSLQGTAAEYDRSLRAVAARLGVDLREVPDWVCCGASSAHALDHDAALVLAGSTLASASRAGMDAVLAPCAMCFQRLAAARHEMSGTPGLGRRVAEALGEPPEVAPEQVRVLNLLAWLGDVAPDALAARVVDPLAGLKVACYYGCLLVRPPRITGAAEVEAPRDMERLVEALGAQPVRWGMQLECCGGSFGVSRTEAVRRQGRRIVDAAVEAGADVVCLACPMCHNNLDMRQAEFRAPGTAAPVPVVYLTQLVGWAMGMREQALGLDGHFVEAGATLRSRVREGEPCRG